jgi:hypothetical protein
MPQGTSRTPGAASGGAPGASPTNPIPVTPGGASPLNVNPAVRNIEKIEK